MTQIHWTKALKQELASNLRRMDMEKAQTKGTDQCTHPNCTNNVWNWTDCCYEHQMQKTRNLDLTPDGFRTGSRPILESMSILDRPELIGLGEQNITLDFIKAGKSIFTVDNGKGTHFTYKVSKKEDGDRTMWFVNLLTGPDNTSNYTYMGMLVQSNLLDKIWENRPESIWYCGLTRASKFNQDSKPVKVLDWALEVVQGYKELPTGYSIQHNGRCAKCARLLTDPESIRLGLGPVCRDQGY